MSDIRKVTFEELISNGVQFGHQTWRWHPKMQPYIWGHKNGVYLIDVSKTAFQIERAAAFLESIAATGKPILWVGTKKAAQSIIKETAERLENPYFSHRWVGGTITNYPQVKKSTTKFLHYEDILSKTDEHAYTKKEYGVMKKIVERLARTIGGIRTLTWPIGALVVVDVRKERTAVREAIEAGVPVVALVDTNSDPSGIDYVIPANDDVPRAIAVIVKYLEEAVARGKVTAAARPIEEITSDASLDQLLAQALGGEEEEEAARSRRRRRPAAAAGTATPGTAPRTAPRRPQGGARTGGPRTGGFRRPTTGQSSAPAQKTEQAPEAPKTETKE